MLRTLSPSPPARPQLNPFPPAEGSLSGGSSRDTVACRPLHCLPRSPRPGTRGLRMSDPLRLGGAGTGLAAAAAWRAVGGPRSLLLPPGGWGEETAGRGRWVPASGGPCVTRVRGIAGWGHQTDSGARGAGRGGGLCWRASRTRSEAPPPLGAEGGGTEGRVWGPRRVRLSRLRFPERQQRTRRPAAVVGSACPGLRTWGALT